MAIAQIRFLQNKAIELLVNNNLPSAEIYLKQAIELQPKNSETLRLLGIVAVQKKELMAALEYFQNALVNKPNDFLIFSNLGNVYLELKQPEAAIKAYDKSIKLNSRYDEVWSNKANALYELKQYEAAFAHHEKALNLNQNNAQAWTNMGNVLHKLNKDEDALLHHENALILNPNYAEAWGNRGLVLHSLKRFQEAVSSFDRAIELDNSSHKMWLSRGYALHDLRQFNEAIISYDRALSLKPNYVEAIINKGLSLHEQSRYKEALEQYDLALELNPNEVIALVNKGITLHDLALFNDAISHYDRAISIDPSHYSAFFNKSLTLLLQGNYESGWPLYQYRFQSNLSDDDVRLSDVPLWTGSESVLGKSIFICTEQGFGDFIQFCRFIKDVDNLGAKVMLEVPVPLHKLLLNLEGVTSYVIKGEERPKADYYCPLLSLPCALKINLDSIPATVNYIRFDVCRDTLSTYREKVSQENNVRIGLAWSGNPKHKNDQNRSIPLNKLIKFLPQQFEYVVLQKEICDDDFILLQSSPNFKSYPNDIVDFTDTAALLNCVDLVISVDTSVAHLASALGKETWLLLQSIPDWRWLLGRTDSPWYPSIKLYRQPSPGDWDSILKKMRFDLTSKFPQLTN